MSRYTISEYTFKGLDSLGKPTGGPTSLAYLVGLVMDPKHAISEAEPAKRILEYLFEVEERSPNATLLDVNQFQFFSRYFSGGYHPQTPCMITKAWSPIGAMLERGFEPVTLRREAKILSVATGIWEPNCGSSVKEISDCATVEELFWAIFKQVSYRAKERKMWVSIIAQPGWNYDTSIGVLPKWSRAEIEKADRVLWQRTPEG